MCSYCIPSLYTVDSMFYDWHCLYLTCLYLTCLKLTRLYLKYLFILANYLYLFVHVCNWALSTVVLI